MPTYAIGDVQGCLDALERLLERIAFDPDRDTLWFVGDLVNRGPHSLETLRFVRGLGERAVTVLGNHDLHLLAAAAGASSPDRAGDTLQPVLEAADRESLLEWLRRRPLLHHDAQLGFTMVHAGLAPQWDLGGAQQRAREVESILRGGEMEAFFANMYGDEPRLWSDDLTGWERVRFIVNAFTRMRYCEDSGALALGAKGPPGSQPAGCLPWFEIPWRANRARRIVFGHWAALGAHTADGVHAIDTGCVWGGALTALRLDLAEPIRYTVGCDEATKIARS